MTISQANIEDLPQILAILALCVRHMDEKGIEQWPDWYPNKEVFERDITKKQLFVAKEKGKVLGFVCLSDEMPPEYNEVNWSTKTPANSVHRLASDPAERSKGVAKRLMDFCEDQARKDGYKSIRLDTYSKNKAANAFYTKIGYRQCGSIHLEFKPEHYPCFEKSLEEVGE